MRLIPQPESMEIFSSVSNCSEITFTEKCESFSSEEYELIIEPDKIIARAADEKGLFYASVTLNQIKLLYSQLPCLVIKDKPRYKYRGFMIDCARHMFKVGQLKKMIDLASQFKFNKFHWHLSDDQGFRIELDSYPELTEKGSVRKCDSFINCKSDKEYSGYYLKSEIREIIAYCKDRFIDVIPEFDMPGHQSAFLHVFPQFTCTGEDVEVKTMQGIFKDVICVGNDDAYQCLEKILDEISDLFPYDKFHIGGDEVPNVNWKTCPKCHKIMADNGFCDVNDLHGYFINKMAGYMKNKGKECIVWNDCLKSNVLTDDVMIQHWQKNPAKTATAANNGQKIILSPFYGYYVDYPYAMHPLKVTYNFEPESFSKLTESGKHNIEGVESPIWTEYINNPDRLEYMCFPRWFAVAETGWTAKNNKNYKAFEQACEQLCAVYRANGFNIADKKEWNPSAPARLYHTIKFFIPEK